MDYIKRYNILVIFVVLICLCTMFFYPVQISNSAFLGAKMWAFSVFPALFPFFVCTNMLISLGFAKFMGEILSPFMIPFFGVSGIGSFPLFSGLLSGYPVGAKITSDLYLDNKLNKKEAQRLCSFCNNCGPLFIVGVLGGYIFKDILVGYYILFIHVLSAILFGFIINVIFGRVNSKTYKRKNFIREAFFQMRLHTSNNNKTFGQILSESVEGAVKSSLNVLGFITLFSVISTVIQIFHLTDIINYLINMIPFVHVGEYLTETVFLGSIEMTAGLFLLDGVINKSNILISIFIVTFGGMSVHAQAISFISKTDLKETTYIFNKFMQSILAVCLGYVFYPILEKNNRTSLESVFYIQSQTSSFMFDFRNEYMKTSAIVLVLLVLFGIILNLKKYRKIV